MITANDRRFLIYIGTQGFLQGRMKPWLRWPKRGRPSLKGKFVLDRRLGGKGGAQPLAVTMNEGVGLIVEWTPAGKPPPGTDTSTGGGQPGKARRCDEALRGAFRSSVGLIAMPRGVPRVAVRGVNPVVVPTRRPPTTS